jgi:excisionase family DNA binding protein
VKDASHSNEGAREDFLTARQLAAIMQVSESTVRRLAREGRIPSVRITPRLLRFNLKAVRHSLEGTSRRHERRPLEDDPQLSFSDLLGEM